MLSLFNESVEACVLAGRNDPAESDSELDSSRRLEVMALRAYVNRMATRRGTCLCCEEQERGKGEP